MTLTPEERAANLLQTIKVPCGMPDLEKAIAQAIRDAESRWKDRSSDLEEVVSAYKDAITTTRDQALEEAAGCVRDNCLPAECHYALEAISALKSKECRMTISPQAQAKLIVQNLRGRQDGWQWAEHVIAQAITQAQDEKLEEAVRMLQAGREHLREHTQGRNARALCDFVDGLVSRIRSLKSKD